ncbi:MAG: hypothetical protein J07HX5_00459 [halophilic archaeon J07HX5]|nr:MAG: hypothetical protein J07HX5_00459 [halophilic archaeon J07HX5]
MKRSCPYRLSAAHTPPCRVFLAEQPHSPIVLHPHPTMSSVLARSELAQHTLREHNPFQIPNNFLNNAQVDSKLVFVILPTTPPFVA